MTEKNQGFQPQAMLVEEYKALEKRLMRSLVVFRDVEDPGFSGSGFLVSWKGRTVVATAAHVATEIHRRDRIGFLWCSGLSPDEDTDRRLSYDIEGAYPDRFNAEDWDNLDVGVVVLKEEAIASAPNIEVVEVGVQPRRSENLRGPLIVLGAPAAASNPEGYLETHLTMQGTLESNGRKRPECPERFITIDWRREAPFQGGEYATSILPGGFSGGPVLELSLSEGIVWSVDSSTILIGIAVRYLSQHQCLLAEPITEWARMMEQLEVPAERARVVDGHSS